MEKLINQNEEQLIQTKKELLGKISKRYDYFLPPYFKPHIFISRRFKIPTCLQLFILVFVGVIVNYIVDVIASASAFIIDFWVYFAFGLLIIIFAFLAIWYIWNKHLNIFEDILKLLINQDQVANIESVFRIMYTNKYQLIVVGFFSVISMVTVVPLYPQMNKLLKIYSVLFTASAAATAGIGAWLAVTSCYFIYKISRFDNLNMNILFPGQTISIIRLSRLFSTYSVLFAIEVLFWIIPYTIFMTTIKNRGVAFNTSSPYYLCGSIFLILIFLFFMPAYFIYPQRILKKIVFERKMKTLFSIQCDMDNACKLFADNNQDLDIQNSISEHVRLFQIVSSAPNLKIGSTSILRFAAPLVISIFLTIAGNPVISAAINNFIKWAYKSIQSTG